VYPGLRLCIDAFAIICIVVGVGLFSGTKRETLWDRDNLVGLLLIGTALSIHGGLDTFFRSSPHAVFSGYVVGWSRPEDPAWSPEWFCLYGLGYPPAENLWDASNRCVYLPPGHNVPGAVWETNETWLLRVTYRTRDLQAVRIEGKPVPLPDGSGLKAGLKAWSWQSNEPVLRPALETGLGLALMLWAAIRFLLRRTSPTSSSLHITLAADTQP